MSNLTSLVLSVVAADRPGIVEKISVLLTKIGGNWLESHLTSVAGQFGGLIHVSIPADSIEHLQLGISSLEKEGFSIIVRESTDLQVGSDFREVDMSLVGNDRPGIIRRISEALALLGINVVGLETEYGSAPMAGHAIFEARSKLLVPPEVSVSELKRNLETIASDLMVDLTFDPGDQ